MTSVSRPGRSETPPQDSSKERSITAVPDVTAMKRERGAPLECRVRNKIGKSTRGAALRLVIALTCASIAGAFHPAQAASRPKVVVLGFDGADYRLVAKGIADGKLPNLAKLAA